MIIGEPVMAKYLDLVTPSSVNMVPMGCVIIACHLNPMTRNITPSTASNTYLTMRIFASWPHHSREIKPHLPHPFLLWIQSLTASKFHVHLARTHRTLLEYAQSASQAPSPFSHNLSGWLTTSSFLHLSLLIVSWAVGELRVASDLVG